MCSIIPSSKKKNKSMVIAPMLKVTECFHQSSLFIIFYNPITVKFAREVVYLLKLYQTLKISQVTPNFFTIFAFSGKFYLRLLNGKSFG